ncbi:MAG: transposase [Elusimicrobia bacterium]|nr:transposase [Elusimicrobiota bacterium]
MLSKLPSSMAAGRTRLRLDGAFYDKDIILPLEGDGYGYAVVATMTGPLKKAMFQAKYHEFAKGWEAAEFAYTPFHWKREHRFAVVRRPSALESEKLRENLFTLENYTYHRAIVHNLDLTPESVWRFYCDRGFQELLLREFKDSYAMAKIPTRSYWANAAYMEMILWAFDLVRAFQFLCLPEEVSHWNIATLRRELWWLPAELVRTDNKNWLRMPRRYPNQKLFEKIYKATARVKPLI